MAWTYADPVGHTREVVNYSVARTVLQIWPTAGSYTVEFTAPVSAFEIG